MIFAGDLWKLGPVRAAALSWNPYRKGLSQRIFKMFWQRNEDSIQKTFELTESKRTTDPLMKAVLKDLGNVLLYPWPAHGESWKLEPRNGISRYVVARTAIH